jgi:serine/threonine-protein kinase
MSVCPKCGTRNRAGWRYCLGCGEELAEADRSESSQSRRELLVRGILRVEVTRFGTDLADLYRIVRTPPPAARSDAPAASVAEHCGPWHLGDVLVAGAPADLYEARNRVTSRRGWVKAIGLPASLGWSDADRWLRREIRLFRELAGPHVVPLIEDGCSSAGWPFFVLCPLPGETLDRRLARRGALDPGEALAITRGIAAALAGVHDAGIVHRAVKPECLFLAEEEPMVRLIDLAIAWPLRREPDLVAPGTYVGVPRYAAPEALRCEPFDHRADIFSIGRVLRQMLTGKLPFEGVNRFCELLARAVADPADLADGPDESLPPVVASLLHKLLRPNPDDRPRSCRVLVAEIDEILRSRAGLPVGQPAEGTAPSP